MSNPNQSQSGESSRKTPEAWDYYTKEMDRQFEQNQKVAQAKTSPTDVAQPASKIREKIKSLYHSKEQSPKVKPSEITPHDDVEKPQRTPNEKARTWAEGVTRAALEEIAGYESARVSLCLGAIDMLEKKTNLRTHKTRQRGDRKKNGRAKKIRLQPIRKQQSIIYGN